MLGFIGYCWAAVIGLFLVGFAISVLGSVIPFLIIVGLIWLTAATCVALVRAIFRG